MGRLLKEISEKETQSRNLGFLYMNMILDEKYVGTILELGLEFSQIVLTGRRRTKKKRHS